MVAKKQKLPFVFQSDENAKNVIGVYNSEDASAGNICATLMEIKFLLHNRIYGRYTTHS